MTEPFKPNKTETFGRKGEPTQKRPGPPPSQNPPLQEQPPSLEQMDGAKNAMMSFLMYYYQSLRMAGHDVDTAKRMMGDEIEKLYDTFAHHARIEFKPEKLMNPIKLLDEIIEDTKSLGVPGKAIHRKLLDFKRLIK